jgi:hypothetical protein
MKQTRILRVFRFQETQKAPPWAFLVSINETLAFRVLFLSPLTT